MEIVSSGILFERFRSRRRTPKAILMLLADAGIHPHRMSCEDGGLTLWGPDAIKHLSARGRQSGKNDPIGDQ